MTVSGHVPSAAASPAAEQRFLEHLTGAAELVSARRHREAEVEVLRALAIVPSDLRALKLLALVRFKLGRLEEARVVCREIAAASPRDPGIHLKLGLIALRLEHLEESVHELETAARLAPEDLRAWSYLGYAYARRGDDARAAAAFRRAGQDRLAAEVEANATGNVVVAPLEQRWAAGAERTTAEPVDGDAVTELPLATADGDGNGAEAGVVAAAADPEGDASAHLGPGAGEGEEAYASVETDAGGRADAPAAIGVADDTAAAPGRSGTGTDPGVGGAVPQATFEPAFDLSMPMNAHAAGHDSEPEERDLLGVAGVAPPLPLVTYAASRLVPPAAHPSWVGSAVRLTVEKEAYVRAEAAVACWGGASWERAERRVKGRATGEPLGDGTRPFFRVAGTGELLVAATEGHLVPLALDDDILYLREDRVLAFDGTVDWEFGHVPRVKLKMLQFRGRGLVALGLMGEAGAVKVTPDRPVFVSAPRLLGWIGRVVARGLEGPEQVPLLGIVCEGEGVVLLDVGEQSSAAAAGGGGGVFRGRA
jgi:uncharacterized protein (AIM24 family)